MFENIIARTHRYLNTTYVYAYYGYSFSGLGAR